MPVATAAAPLGGSLSRAAYYRLGLVLAALSALGPLAIDMYLPSFPAIASDLGAPASAVQVTVAVYFVGLAVGQAFYGPLADRYGRKKPLYAGLGVFVLASVACALARSIEALIAFRFLQALGGAAQMVVARAVVRDYFGEREAARMLSFLMLVMGLAPILAPMLGGQLVVAFGWHAVFWVLVGAGTLCLLAVAQTLPESLPAEHRQRHGAGAVLKVYGALLRDRAFLAHALAGSLVMAGMFAYIAGSPFVFIEVFGVAPEHFGLFFGMNAFGLIAASQVNGRLVRRVGAAGIVRVVLVVAAAAGLVLAAAAASGVGGFAGFLAPLFVFVASLGFIAPNTAALALAPHGRTAGSASALLGTLQFLVGAGAGALVGVLSDGTALPMPLVIAGCGLGAVLVHRLLGAPAAPTAPAAPAAPAAGTGPPAA